jgi:hypothetical protein
MKVASDDRRRFLRITDAIGLNYTLIKDNSDDGLSPTESGVNVK